MLKLVRTFRVVRDIAREFQPTAQKGGGIFDATHAAAIQQYYLDTFKPNRYPGKEYSDLIIQLGFVRKRRNLPTPTVNLFFLYHIEYCAPSAGH